MSISTVRPILLATAFMLAGCGGGGGYDVAFTPTPVTSTPTLAAPPAIIPAATTSQQFTTVGATHTWDGDQSPLLGAADQLQVWYDQPSNSYAVQIPHSQTAGAINPVKGSTTNFEGAIGLTTRQTGYQYSNVLSWGDGATYFGTDAVGVATPAGGVPVTGTASYSGNFWGPTSETYAKLPVSIFGGVELSFDFGMGSLSGRVLPSLFYQATYDDYTLAPVNFRDTVYSRGSTGFSGKFETNLSGVNSFSGLFTGPKGQELIGNFALPYKSPMDGQTYQSDGAFDAKK